MCLVPLIFIGCVFTCGSTSIIYNGYVCMCDSASIILMAVCVLVPESFSVRMSVSVCTTWACWFNSNHGHSVAPPPPGKSLLDWCKKNFKWISSYYLPLVFRGYAWWNFLCTMSYFIPYFSKGVKGSLDLSIYNWNFTFGPEYKWIKRSNCKITLSI